MQKYYALFNRHFFWVLLALLVFIPLYPKFPLVGVSGTFVSIRLEDFIIALVILLWFVAKLPRLKSYFNSTIAQAFLLFWGIGLLGVMSGLLITHSLSFGLGFLNWARRVEVMLLFFVAATTIQSLKQVKIILTVMLITTLLIIFYGFGQQWLHFPVVSTTNKEFSKGIILYLTGIARVSSTFAGYYDLAAYLTMVLALLGSLYFYYKKKRTKVILVITGFLSFILLGMTSARVSFVAAIISLSLAFWLNGKKVFIGALLVLSIVTALVIPNLRNRLIDTVTVNLLHHNGPTYNPPSNTVNLFTPVSKIPESSRAAFLAQALKESTLSATQASKIAVDIAPGEPVNSTALGVERSLGIRTNVEWPRAMRAFLWNPFLGTGYSSITLATDNDYLRSLGETGILGTLALVLVFFILIKRFLIFRKQSSGFDRYFINGMLCMVVAILITSTFIDILEASKIAEVMWIILGVSWALMEGYGDTL